MTLKQRHMRRGFACEYRLILKHTTKLFALSDHYILSREWRVIVDQIQNKYMMLLSVRCDRPADYEGSLLLSDVF